jgi:hypothetical protein
MARKKKRLRRNKSNNIYNDPQVAREASREAVAANIEKLTGNNIRPDYHSASGWSTRAQHVLYGPVTSEIESDNSWGSMNVRIETLLTEQYLTPTTLSFHEKRIRKMAEYKKSKEPMSWSGTRQKAERFIAEGGIDRSQPQDVAISLTVLENYAESDSDAPPPTKEEAASILLTLQKLTAVIKSKGQSLKITNPSTYSNEEIQVITNILNNFGLYIGDEDGEPVLQETIIESFVNSGVHNPDGFRVDERQGAAMVKPSNVFTSFRTNA